MNWKVVTACVFAAVIASCSDKPKPLGISMDQLRDNFNKAIVSYNLSASITPIGRFSLDGNQTSVPLAKPDTKNKCSISLILLDDKKTINSIAATTETRSSEERDEAIPCVVTAMLSADPSLKYADAISVISDLVRGVVKTSNGLYDTSLNGYRYSMSLLKVKGLTIMSVSVSK